MRPLCQKHYSVIYKHFLPEHWYPFLGGKAPVTLGHEFAGVVEEVGANVNKFAKGDRVVVNPTVSKREKEIPQSHHQNLNLQMNSHHINQYFLLFHALKQLD